MCFGPDVSASLDLKQLSQLIEGKKAIHQMLSNPVDKNELRKEADHLSKTFGKSLALREDLNAGEKILKENLTMKKPGFGLPLSMINEIVGKKATRTLSRHRLLSIGDFE